MQPYPAHNDDQERADPPGSPGGWRQGDTARGPVGPATTGSDRRSRPRWWRWLMAVLVLAILAPPVLGLALIGAIYVQARTDQARTVDAIVVLGTTQFNGVPQPVLRARLQTALALYRDGLAPTIIVTGGGMPGDVYTEAEAGQMYLVEAGVPEAAIVLENAGRDSWQSMEAVAGILEDRDLDRVLLVSDGFHLLRLKLMARDLGITAFAAASDGSPIRGGQEFGYVVREAFAITAFIFGRR